MRPRHNKLTRPVIFFATLLFIVFGTLVMIRYAKGYRPTMTGRIKGTGLLSANSYPTAAQVFVNSNLSTATDATLNLEPGTYEVEIRKDGYHTWKKTLTIEQELVTETSALLLPTSPTLEPVTFTGALSPVPSPDGDQVAYLVASSSALPKNGLYVQDLASSPISLARPSRQIASSTASRDLSQATYAWSPTGDSLLVVLSPGEAYLLDSSRMNNLSELPNIAEQVSSTLSEWEEELARLERTRLLKLPEFFQGLATSSATNLYFSPDSTKLLYEAGADLTIPTGLVPPLPASSTQVEARDLKIGNWYIYDLVEDRNFLVASGSHGQDSFVPSKLSLLSDIKSSIPSPASTSASSFEVLQHGFTLDQSLKLLSAQYNPLPVDQIQWLPDSTHLIISRDHKIDISEYDGTNVTTIYAGPFDSSFVYPAPDSSRLFTLIQFTKEVNPNLYTIKLK